MMAVAHRERFGRSRVKSASAGQRLAPSLAALKSPVSPPGLFF